MSKSKSSIRIVPFRGEVGIQKPAPGTTVPVRSSGGSGFICAEGGAPGSGLNAVFGKVVSGSPGSAPPAGAMQGCVVQNYGSVNWVFYGANEIPGVQCSGSAPFPQNTLAIWSLNTAGSYCLESVTFNGSCSDHTECAVPPVLSTMMQKRRNWPERLLAAVRDTTGDYKQLPKTLEFCWDPMRQWWLAEDPNPDRGPYLLFYSQYGPTSGYLLSNPSLHPALVSPEANSRYFPLCLEFDLAGCGQVGRRGGFKLTVVDPESR